MTTDLRVGRPLARDEIVELLTEARERTEALVAPISDEDLRTQHSPLMSPIVWDLGHIAHFEDVWLREKLTEGSAGDSEGLRGIYNPFENPRAGRHALDLPDREACRRFMAEVRASVVERIDRLDPTAAGPLLRDGFVFRMVLQHEYQHNETMLQTLQLKQGAPYAPSRRGAAPERSADAPPIGSEAYFPGGEVVAGTDDHSAAYDNERPAHAVRVEPFRIDVHPVTNVEYEAFVDDGGYERSELWRPGGWAWKEEAGLTGPKYWAGDASTGRTERVMDRTVPLRPGHPVCHVGYWEADAYARWAGKRLPTEIEWEVAASWDPETGTKRIYPWGDLAPTGRHANLDALLFDTTPVGTYPAGVSPIGCWDMLGNVWEWTASDFSPYPGFRAFPYPEYSEVFFGEEYKVLRGGSWATRYGAIRNTFRNWDYPIRRQIFSGIRCARDG